MARINTPYRPTVAADSDAFFPTLERPAAPKESGFEMNNRRLGALADTVNTVAKSPLTELAMLGGRGMYRSLKDLAQQQLDERRKASGAAALYDPTTGAPVAAAATAPAGDGMDPARFPQQTPQLDREAGFRARSMPQYPGGTPDRGMTPAEGAQFRTWNEPGGAFDTALGDHAAAALKPSIADVARQRLAPADPLLARADEAASFAERLAPRIANAGKFYPLDPAERARKFGYEDGAAPVAAEPADQPPLGLSLDGGGTQAAAPDATGASTDGVGLSAATQAGLSRPQAAMPKTLGEATPEQLATVKQRIEAHLQTLPPEQRELWEQRLADVNREIDFRNTPDDREITEQELYAMASQADTPAARAAALQAIERTRFDSASLDDILGGSSRRAVEQVKGLFPSARDEVARQNAETREKSAEGLLKLRERQAAVADARIKELEALLPGKQRIQGATAGNLESQTEAREAESPVKVADIRSRTAERDAMLKPKLDQIAADTERMRAIAAKAKRPAAGRGIRMGPSKDDLAWVKATDAREKAWVAAADDVAEGRERVAAKQIEIAETARQRAEEKRAEAGNEPALPTEDTDPAVASTMLRMHDEWQRRVGIAAAAEKAAKTAEDKADKARTDLQAAQRLREQALEAGKTQRALSEEIMRTGIGATRKRMNTAPAGAPQAAPAPTAPPVKQKKPIQF